MNLQKRQKQIDPLEKVFTNKDITTNYIVPLLSPLNVWALYQAYPRLVSKMSFFDRFIQVLQFYLDKKGVNIDINNPQIALTGGFLINVLYDDYKKESDIDLLHIDKTFRLDQYEPKRDLTRVAYYEVLYPMIKTIVEYPNDIQLIGIKCDYKTYVNNFDLEFCSSYYSNGKLYTKSCKNDLIRKTFTFNPDVILHQVSKHEILSVSWLSYDVAKRLLERIKKYSKRGFKITIMDRDDWYSLYLKLEKNVLIDCMGNVSNVVKKQHLNNTEKGRLELCNALATYWTGFWLCAEILHNSSIST